MTKFTKEVMYQELSIQISCLDMKLQKILELLNKPEWDTNQDIRFIDGKPGHGASFVGVLDNICIDYTNRCDKITPKCFDGPCDCTIKPSLPDNEAFDLVKENT